MKKKKYFAFISYQRKDEDLAERLRKRLDISVGWTLTACLAESRIRKSLLMP